MTLCDARRTAGVVHLCGCGVVGVRCDCALCTPDPAACALQVISTSKSVSSSHAKIVFHATNNSVRVLVTLCCCLFILDGAPVMHAVLCVLRVQKAKIVDLSSLNGTFVNDARVQNSAVNLASGDAIRFGYDPMVYRYVLACGVWG